MEQLPWSRCSPAASAARGWRTASRRISASASTVIVNTADDTERHGLLVSPDHDTVMYTLAGIDNREWGWGIAGETFAAAAMLERYGEEIVVPARRSRPRDPHRPDRAPASRRPPDRRSRATSSTRSASRATILPMSDQPVRTEVLTDDGWLAFQDYFVRLHQEPEVRDVRFVGIEEAPRHARRSRPRSSTPTRDRHRALESVRVGPADPRRGRHRGRAPDGTGSRGAGRRRVRDRRWRGAQGPGGSDARLARARGERARGGARSTRGSPTSSSSTGSTRSWRHRSGRSGCRTRGHRHDHGRRRRRSACSEAGRRGAC